MTLGLKIANQSLPSFFNSGGTLSRLNSLGKLELEEAPGVAVPASDESTGPRAGPGGIPEEEEGSDVLRGMRPSELPAFGLSPPPCCEEAV